MHSKLTFAGLLLMCVGMTITSSCATDPIMPSKTELYNREFIKNFGVFDRSNDWNYSNKASVTVTTPSPTDIKIYANVNGKRYLFGTFLGVDGTKELAVDVPKGITSLIVKAKGKDIVAAVGSKVNLGRQQKSRVINEGTVDGDFLTVSRATEIEFPASYIGDVIDKVPEEKDNLNREGILTDFSFVSEAGKSVTIYPVFWNTAASHVLGVYWLNEDDSFPWCANEEEIEQVQNEWGGTKAIPSYANMRDLYYTRSAEMKFLNPYDNEWHRLFGQSSYPSYIYYDIDSDGTISDEYRPLKGSFRTNGVSIKFKKSGIKFGFYIKVKTKSGENKDIPVTITGPYGDNQTFYPKYTLDVVTDGPCVDYEHIIFSHTRRNKNYGRIIKDDSGKFVPSTPLTNPNDDHDSSNALSFNGFIWNHPWGGVESLQKYVGASYFKVTNRNGVERTFFAFEDYRNIPDLNDLVFLIDSKVVTVDETTGKEIEDPDTPYEWIIAVEDLGATDDFDFNDVVFGVSNPVTKADGKKYVTVRALASGGTLPVYVRYKGVDIVPDVTNEGEFHSWFEGNHPSNVVINAQGVRSTGKSYELQVDDTFTLSCLQEINGTNMGGFSVRVVKKDNSEVTEIAPPNLSEGGSEAPQMMCLPISWQWPIERTHISDAYAEFANWTKNHEDNTDWHKNVTAPSLVWKRTDIAQ